MASFNNEEDNVSKAKRQKCSEESEECKEDDIERSSNSVEEPSYDEIHENDLPLLSNIEKVRIVHYLMKLRFDMKNQTVYGNLTLFLKWNIDENESEGDISFLRNEIILDCCSIKVHKVSSLKCVMKTCITKNEDFSLENIKPKKFNWFAHPEVNQLQFVTKRWSLNIQGWPENEFPIVIRIEYETLPSTPSLHWQTSFLNISDNFNSSNADCCVYTPASPVNNRGLFPCQEPPTAMATWECLIELESSGNYTALLASDEPGCPVETINSGFPNLSTYYYNCSMILPMSTFAVAIGTICHANESLVTVNSEEICPAINEESNETISCKNHELYPCRLSSNHKTASNELIPVRLFSFCDNFLNILFLEKDLSIIMPKLLSSTFAVLGPHPFARLDIVIMPKSFPSLGLANPNMIFFSPSSFYGCQVESPQRYSYCSRVAHEISHSWFGLLIGALDWTEEWLSEGFATFMEDILYKRTLIALENELQQKIFENECDIDEQLSMRSILRLMNLQNEMNNTEQNKQVLSPMEKEEKSVKNALAPEKQFMQIHYLKGYFFLRHLSELVGGDEKFTPFLKSYVLHFHGQLVTSRMFLIYFQSFFSESLLVIKDADIEDLERKWLQSPDLKEPYKSAELLLDFENVNFDRKELIQLFPKCENPLRKCHSVLAKCIEKSTFKYIARLSCGELVYALENISLHTGEIFSKKLCRSMFKYLGFTLETMHNLIPEVLHCLCEMVIKIKDRERLPIIEKFLLDHPAMGVYIYGELMISEKRSFQDLARSVYHKQETVLEKSILKVLNDMIF